MDPIDEALERPSDEQPQTDWLQVAKSAQPATAPASPAAPAPKGDTDWTALAAQASSAQAQPLRAAVVQAAGASPDRAADVRRLSEDTGLPTSYVDRNYDDVKKQQQITSTPYEQIQAQTPNTAAWLQQGNNAAVAKDDLSSLGALEWLVKAPQRAFAQGMDSTRYALLRAESITRNLTQQEQDQLASYKYGMERGGGLGADDSWFRGAVTGFAKNLPMLFGAALYANKYGIAGGATTAAVGAVMGAPAGGVGAVPGAAAGAGVGYAVGSMYGGFKFAQQLAAGQAYDEYLSFKDELGRPLDPAVAKAAALATGYINGALMAGGFHVLAESVPGVDKLTGFLTQSAVQQALLQPTVRAGLLAATKTAAGTLTFETANMVAQRAAQILIGDVAKGQSGQPFANRDAAESGADLLQTGAGALRDFALLTAAGPLAGVAMDRIQARDALHNATFFKALGEGVAGSKTAQRLPEAFQSFLADATKDGPIETVYAPIDTWQTYWQSKGVDPKEMAQRLTGNPEAFDQAVRTGEDLAIPTATYGAKLAATSHNDFFAHELRFAPEQMNAREAQAFEQRIADEQQAEADRLKADAVHEAAAPVREKITAQLVAAGMERSTAEAHATLYQHVFQTLGERAGVDPVELFNRYGLTVERPELAPDAKAGETQLDQQPRPEFVPVGGESAENADRQALQLTDEQRRAELARAGEADPAKAAMRDAIKGEARVLYQSPTETDAFKTWFGESKMVDEQGKPRVLYHGTAADFDTFDMSKTGEGRGAKNEKAFFFAATPDTANHSASVAGVGLAEDTGQYNAAKTLQDALGVDMPEKGSVVYPVYLKLENPFLSTMEHYNGREMAKEIKAAKKAGHDGIVFPLLKDSGEADTVAVFAPEQVKSALGNTGAFDPTNPSILHQEARGFIRISPDRKLTIGLLKGADLSTFLHETGHGFLEVMRDLAKEPGADSIRADLATLDTHLFAGAESETEKHERFARGFEAYLMEGKAPSAELRPVFARFRSWLVGVYRSLKQLNIELSPEVRSVFDRVLASDEAIQQAEAEGRVEPLFTDATMAGMTPEAFDAYRTTVQAASDRAKDELQAKLMADLTRERRAYENGERDTIRTQVEFEVHQEPIYQALAAIRKGTRPDGSPLVEGKEPEPLKLAKADLVDRYTPDELKALRNRQLYAVDGGMKIDTAAELYGFSSGDELVKALIAAPSMKDRIDAETTTRLKAKLGDILVDGQLSEQARQAVNGEGRQEVIKAELKALTAGMAKGTIPPARVINGLAEARIATMAVRDLRPGQFLMAARRASQRAFDLLSTHQDRDGAIQAKQQELQNLANYRAATDAREQSERIAQHFGPSFDKSSTRQRLGKAGGGILEQIDAVRDRFSFANVSLKEIDRRAALDKWASARKAMGLPTDLPPELLDEARRTHYKNLSVEELRGVNDGLRMLEHFATLKNKLLTARDKREFDATRDGMVQSIGEHGTSHPPRLEVLPGEAKTRTVGDMIAAHTRLSTLVDRIDGYKPGGPVWETVMRPINEAATAKALRYESEGRVMRDILREAYTPQEIAHLHDQTYIPEIGASLSKEGRLSVALNWGNEGNRQRLMETTRRKWNAEQVQAILNTLDVRDLRFVQRSIDHLASFAPEIAAQEERINGVKPEMVEASSWTHETHGEQKGGYYPIAYDTRLASPGGGIPDPEQADLQQYATAARLQTKQGYTKAREEQVNAPVRLELSVMQQHVDAVIHSLTHREMLIDVGRLMVDRQMRDAIEARHGDIVYKEMKGALMAVALGKSSGTVVKAVDYIRNGKTIAGLGWNVKTALLHLSGIANGAAEIGPAWTARAMGRVFQDAAGMEYSARWVSEKSAQMRLFGTNADREIADLHAELRRGGSWFDTMLRTVSSDQLTRDDITKSYTAMIRSSIKLAATVTWVGGYEKEMAEGTRLGLSPEARESRAIALADQYVDNAHGGGQIKDLARVQRGGSVAKLFTSFYTYGAVKFNQVYRVLGRTDFRRVGSVGQAFGDLALIGIAPAAYSVAVAKAFGKIRDEEGWFVPLAKEGLAEAMSMLIGIRDLAPGAEWLVDKTLSPGRVPEMHGYEGPAGLGVLPDLEKLMEQVGQGQSDRGLSRAGAEVGGELFHAPLPQIERSVEGLMDLHDGTATNPGAALMGPPPRKP